MSPGNLAILGLVVVFLFMFAIGNIEYSLPLFQRIKFDNVCNKYLSVIQAEGGLNAIDRNNLVSELDKMGFTNISITAPTKLAWNNEAILRIEADYTFKRAIRIFSNSTKGKENNRECFGRFEEGIKCSGTSII